jgi:hypothetical protein
VRRLGGAALSPSSPSPGWVSPPIDRRRLPVPRRWRVRLKACFPLGSTYPMPRLRCPCAAAGSGANSIPTSSGYREKESRRCPSVVGTRPNGRRNRRWSTRAPSRDRFRPRGGEPPVAPECPSRLCPSGSPTAYGARLDGVGGVPGRRRALARGGAAGRQMASGPGARASDRSARAAESPHPAWRVGPTAGVPGEHGVVARPCAAGRAPYLRVRRAERLGVGNGSR